MKKSLLINIFAALHHMPVLAILGCCLTFQPLLAQPGAILFRDDFNQKLLGPKWKSDDAWVASNGAAVSAYDAGALVTSKRFDADSYVIETAAMGFTGSYWREFRITFGQADVSEQKAYVLNYGYGADGRLSLGRATDNLYHPDVLDEVSLYPELETTRWYRFKIARYKSGLMQVFLNRGSGYEPTPVLEAIDSAYPQLGHFGWMVSTQTAGENFFVDWMEVRVPQSEKPALPEKPEEDNLITQVSDAEGMKYRVSKLTTGSALYTDRESRITSMPSYLQGASFIQTAIASKNKTQTSWLTTFIKRSAILYIAYDQRAAKLPAWLREWHKTGDVLGTTDPGSKYMEIYSKTVDSWQLYPRPLILGGNMEAPAAGAKMNYIVLAVPQPERQNLEAEDAVITGAKMAKNHLGYSGSGFVDFINPGRDYVEWTTEVKIPGTYSLGIQFSNASKNIRTMHLSVDDVAQGTATFIPINSWDSWAFYSGSKVFLKKGKHRIRLTANGTSGPNIDYLTVNFYSDYDSKKLDTYARTGAFDLETTGVRTDAAPMAYPNPFELSTSISYQLPESTMVNLAIYTSDGRKQAVLVDQMQAAGQYQIEFNADNLSKGTYIYHLKQGHILHYGKLIKH